MRTFNSFALSCALLGPLAMGAAHAGGASNNECPVGVLEGSPGDESTTLDLEFGPGTSALTRCLERRHKVKVVVQVNQFCRDIWNKQSDGSLTPVTKIAECKTGRAFALGNIANMLNDYEITHGMRPGKDFEVVAVVHSGGGDLVLKDGYSFDNVVNPETGETKPVTISNPFQGLVEELMDRGVRFLFCQNTTRSFVKGGKLPSPDENEGGGATDAIIPGVEYTTAGVTAIADLQSQGYKYVQP
jgi:intracellular sulfur oxidation DsrE/DsrF family protein